VIPRIELIQEKKLVGKRLSMSFTVNRTYQLWSSFMPRRKEIKNNTGTELYSLEIYPPLFFNDFDPETSFEKWAAIEVTDFNNVPDGMETLVLPAGLYAVFTHHGPASEGPKTYDHIFRTWLPAADYLLDNRPHFALMGEKYKQDAADTEEEIWIPVSRKS
jgi:AraC family transcriptional regulator